VSLVLQARRQFQRQRRDDLREKEEDSRPIKPVDNDKKGQRAVKLYINPGERGSKKSDRERHKLPDSDHKEGLNTNKGRRGNEQKIRCQMSINRASDVQG